MNQLFRWDQTGLFLLALAAGILPFAVPEVCAAALREGLTLCSGPLLLSLFPFLVVSRLLIQCPESDLLALPFRLAAWGIGIRTPCAARVLCIGFLGGFAPAASAAAQAVRTGQLTAEEADALLPACICSGPSFVVLTVVLTGVSYGLLPSILRWMRTPEDVYPMMYAYVQVILVGLPFIFLYNYFAFLLRAVGNSLVPLVFLGVSTVLNIGLDVLLVAVLGMGVAGAALATITSQLLSAVLVVLALMKTDDMYKLEWKKVRIDQRMLQRIVRIGIPAGMQSVMYNISNVIIQAGVNTLGTDNVTAWATYGKVDGLYWMMINALGISVTTFVGQNFGAGRLDRVRKGAGACMVIGVALTASVGVVLYNGGHLLVELFTTDQQVQAISMDLLHFMVPTFITYIAIEILSGTLRGVGDAWMPLIITGIGVCAVRVLWIMFVLPHYHTIIGAAFCYPLTWSLTTVAFVIYYYFFSSLRRWKLKPLKKRFGVYKPF